VENEKTPVWDFSRSRIGLDRKLSDYSKIRWLVTRLIKNNSLFYRKLSPGAYLNLGCGPNINENFVCVDGWWVPGIDICCDMIRGLPVPANFSKGIFTEHCLEHLALEDAKALLADCRRVLMPNSLIRIVVPDLELYARAYVKTLDGQPAILPNEYFVNRTGVNAPVAVINELFYGSGHEYMYDFQALSDLLVGAGFSDIRKCSFRSGRDERLLIDDVGHISESLYVEARKA